MKSLCYNNSIQSWTCVLYKKKSFEKGSKKHCYTNNDTKWFKKEDEIIAELTSMNVVKENNFCVLL